MFREHKQFFMSNIKRIINEHINSLGDFHTADIATYKDKDGKDLETVPTTVTNITEFVQEIAKIRNIKRPRVILGCDGGQDKVLVTAIILEEGEDLTEEDEQLLDAYKPTGKNRVLILGKVDGVPENRHNVELLLNSLNLPELEQDFQVVWDLKLIAIIIGIQTCLAMYGCPFGDCYKVDIETGTQTNKKGIYKKVP